MIAFPSNFQNVINLVDGLAVGLIVTYSIEITPSACVRFVIGDAVEHTVGAVFGIVL